MGGLFAETGSLLGASQLWGQSEKLLEDCNEPLPIPEQERLDTKVAAARATLNDDAAFDAAWQQGRSMALEEAILLALRPIDTV